MEIKFSQKPVSEVLDIDPENLPYTFLPAYNSFIKSIYGSEVLVAFAEKEKTVIALSRVKSKFIVNAQLLSEPFTASGPMETAAQENFFNVLVKAMKQQNIADRIITPQNFVVLGGAPQQALSCRFGSYVTDLTPNVEELFSKVHPKHRNKISKAERAGVEIRTGKEELPVFYQLYSDTMKRSDMYCEPYSFFESLYRHLGNEHCICTVAYHNGNAQGALLAPYTKYCCYYVYGASSGTITESGSINFLHWKTMLLMKERGVKLYDFVGARLSDVSNTRLEGIQSFKERFGCELKKGYLFKTDIHPMKCKTFDLLLRTSNKIRGKKAFKDIIDQEIEKQQA